MSEADDRRMRTTLMQLSQERWADFLAAYIDDRGLRRGRPPTKEAERAALEELGERLGGALGRDALEAAARALSDTRSARAERRPWRPPHAVRASA